MISASDRQQAVELIDEARRAGARLKPACQTLGLEVRTYQRWTHGGGVRSDGRPDATRPVPANKLSDAERAQVLATCHSPAHANLTPMQIVPRLADQGLYLASEATFYRVLREHGEQTHRGRAQPPRPASAPPRLCAQAPCQIWSWDISWLPGPVKGLFFYLYLIVDLHSRKIVGWEVHQVESAEHAATVVQRAVLAEQCVGRPIVLHADNGSPMKGEALLATLYRLGVATSYSRPRTSNDNPYSEALFRTCKYRPDYPAGGFASLDQARQWVHGFVEYYNYLHRHSAIQFVTPAQRHRGEDVEILAQRQQVYEQARDRHPQRWAGKIRNFEPAGDVWLNPSAEVVEPPEQETPIR